MGKLIFTRLLLLIPVLLAISLIVFLLLRLAPGDPVSLASSAYNMTFEQQEALREALGLNDPWFVQFGHWLGNALTGDLGNSFYGSESVSEAFLDRLPATVEVTASAMIVALLTGLPAGVIAAYKQNTTFDKASMVSALLGVSMPSFWLGLAAIYVFGIRLRWFAISGRISIDTELDSITNLYVLDSILTVNMGALIDVLRHLALPALVLGLVQTAFIARMTRATMLEVLPEDYIRTARSKGLSEPIVLIRHAFRNAMIPVVTIIGLQVGFLLGGSIILENVFSWPGLGKLLVDSVLSRDYPMVQGLAILMGAIFALVNLFTDIVYTFINPQIHDT